MRISDWSSDVCSSDLLSLKRKSQLAQGLPPIYDRAALGLGAAEQARLEAQGRRPHWRFLLEPGAIEWHDLVRGPVHFDAADLSDPVLIREDGRPLYHEIGRASCRERVGQYG